MANPNIVNVSTINGLITANTPTGTSPVTLVSNSASSGQVFKINSLTATNMAGSAVSCTVAYNTGAAGVGTSYPIANTIPVPTGSTLLVIDKSSSIYLNENNSLVITSGTASGLSFVCSYEVIS